jgi:hypothetical protein
MLSQPQIVAPPDIISAGKYLSIIMPQIPGSNLGSEAELS